MTSVSYKGPNPSPALEGCTADISWHDSLATAPIEATMTIQLAATPPQQRRTCSFNIWPLEPFLRTDHDMRQPLCSKSRQTLKQAQIAHATNFVLGTGLCLSRHAGLGVVYFVLFEQRLYMVPAGGDGCLARSHLFEFILFYLSRYSTHSTHELTHELTHSRRGACRRRRTQAAYISWICISRPSRLPAKHCCPA